MTPPGKQSSRVIDTLVSLASEGNMPPFSHSDANFAQDSALQPSSIDSGNISHAPQVIAAAPNDSIRATGFEDPTILSDISLHPEPDFDWLDLPLNGQLFSDKDFADMLWDDPCDQGHVHCGMNEHYF